jgi:GT2 family glycosyltransferase
LTGVTPAVPTLVASVVLYRPDAAVLAATLRSLTAAATCACREGALGGARLILVDHSPQAQTEAMLAEWRTLCGDTLPLEYVSDPSNPGFGAGHNRAFALAGREADVFLVANPDLEFAADSLAAGLRFLAAHPASGLVAPALLKDDGSLAPACFRYPDLLTLALRLVGGHLAEARSRRYECRDWDATRPVFDPPIVSGCCMLFRRDAFAALGGFDPGYFLYFEDFDLSRRASRRELLAYCPGMHIRHHGGGAGRKGLRHVFLFLRSARRFFSAHGWRWF